ncbi:MAG: hypothetical protein JNL28_12455 [Planctomycetes bacterium]|nr:hypothetical protein [Planctomycetota bacterium]
MHFTRPLFFLVALLTAHSARAQSSDAIIHLGSRAPGSVLVTRTGNVFSMRFSGDEVIDYRIDLDATYVSKGRISVYEASSECWPLLDTNPGYRDANGGLHAVGWLSSYASLTSATMTADSVILDYTDDFTPIGEGVRHRRTTFTLRGKMLTVRYQDLDQSTSYNANYIGILQGDGIDFDSPQVLRLMGAMLQPIVRFTNAAGKDFYYSNILDLYNTNASNYAQNQTPLVPGPTTTKLAYNYSTWNQYAPLTNGTQIAAPIDDTFRVIVTSRIEEAYVTPTQDPSPYRELLTNRMALLLGAPPFANYPPLWNLFDTWGVDNIAAYFFNWSAAQADAPAGYNVGPDWWPPTDPGGFQNAMQAATAKGFLIGAYNSYNTMPPSAPGGVFNSTHYARASNGQPKLTVQFGLPVISTTASGIHAARESQLLKNNAGANLGYLDIQTYSSPSRGADGDHIDQQAGSPWAKTMRAACLDQKTWMRALQDTYQGPLLGEGSFIDPGSNNEYLWGGYCDGTQRTLNTGTSLAQSALPATRRGWSLSVTGWPVVPEIDWRILGPLQVNHGNGFYERFFAAPDGPAIVTAAGVPISPLTEPAYDRYRIYELSFGKAGFMLTNGFMNGVGNYSTHADLLREYFMTNALQARYTRETPSSIDYLHEGVFKSFQTILEETHSLEPFRDARLRIRFASGLELWLNHANPSWIATVGGVTYTIPVDGFVAVQPASGLVAFSAVPPGTGGARIDYCLDPAAYEFFDGRGVVSGYGGQTTTANGVAFTSFSRGRTFREAADGTIVQVGATNAPVLLRVEVTPRAQTLSPGTRRGYRATAVYQNGARRDVTRLVNWSTGNAGVASINNGAALTANGSGTTSVTVTPWNGAPVVPATVSVP